MKKVKLKDRRKAPTPTRFKRIRNIAGTIAGVAGILLLAPLSAPILTTIGIVGGIAGIIAAHKTIDEKEAEKMSAEALQEVQSKLRYKKFNDPTDISSIEKDTLDIVNEELRKRRS